MLVIPTQAVASQTFRAILGGQACRIALYQKSTGLFCDLYVNDVLIVAGVLCLAGVKMVRSLYLAFAGDLAIFDTQLGAAGVAGFDPEQVHYTGLGGRYFLAYLP